MSSDEALTTGMVVLPFFVLQWLARLGSDSARAHAFLAVARRGIYGRERARDFNALPRAAQCHLRTAVFPEIDKQRKGHERRRKQKLAY